MVGFGAVVRVLVEDVPGGRDDLVDHARVHRCPIRGDFDRRRAVRESAGEERPCGAGVAALADQYVDDLTVLIDRAVQVGPPARDLDVRFIDEPPITRHVACRTRGVDELLGEGLHPPIHRHVINVDAALGQQLLHVAVRQPVAQIPTNRHRDHLTREAMASGSSRASPRIDPPISLPIWGPPSQRNSPRSLFSSNACSTSVVGMSRPRVRLGIPPHLADLELWGRDVAGEWWAPLVWSAQVPPPAGTHPVPVGCAAWVPGLQLEQPLQPVEYLQVRRMQLPAEPAGWPAPVDRPGAHFHGYYLG